MVNSKKILFYSLMLVSVLSGGYVFAWTGPSANPPENNAFEPLNIGPSAQTKLGDLDATRLCINSDCKDAWPVVSGVSLWTEAGSDIYRSDGRVGIGTSSPTNFIGGAGSLHVNGEVRATRFYDDDPNYYADLNTGGNLGGTWSISGNIYVGGVCFRPRILVRCSLPWAADHLTWVDNQGECTGAGGVIEQTVYILAGC